MNRKTTTEKAERLVPGSALVLVQLYRSSERSYSQAPGMSSSGIQVASQRELKRLWKAIDDVINGAKWRDINQVASPAPESLTA